MRRHWTYGSCVAVLLGTACVVPATSNAATVFTLTIGPLKARSYAMTMVPQCGRGGCGASILFSRAMGKGSQTHQYSATKGKVTATSLRSAKVTATFGSLGTMNMTFHAKSVKRAVLPKSCKGKAGKIAVGTVTGRFTLKADANYFKTVSARTLPATVASSAVMTCTPTSSPHAVYFGSTSVQDLDPSFYATRSGPTTTISATAYEQRGGVRISHTLVVPTSAAHLVTAADLSSATLTGAGALTGTVSATFPSGSGAQAIAPLSGQLTGHFDSLGTVDLVKAGGSGYVGMS